MYFFRLTILFIWATSLYAEQSFTINCTNFKDANIFLDGKNIGLCEYSKEQPYKTVGVSIPDEWYTLKLIKHASTYWDYTRSKDVYVLKDRNNSQYIDGLNFMSRAPRQVLLEKIKKRNSMFHRVDDKVLHDSFLGLVWADDAAMKSAEMSINNAVAFCESYEHKEYKSWRLPSHAELSSLLSYYIDKENHGNDSLNRAVKTKPVKYWVHPKPLTFWETITFENLQGYYIDFKSGEIESEFYNDALSALCVHDTKDKVTNWLTKEKDTVRDKLNNIIWQDQPHIELTSLNAEASVKYCNSLVIGQIKGWRLPTMSELLSIVDVSSEEGLAIDKVFSARNAGDGYISGTPAGGDAHYILDPRGTMDLYSLNSDRSAYVRCVKDIE